MKPIRRFIEAQILRELDERLSTDSPDARKMNYSKVKDETKQDSDLPKAKKEASKMPVKAKGKVDVESKHKNIKSNNMRSVKVSRDTKEETPTIKNDKFDDSETMKALKEACWKGYKQLGMKKKGKRTVPNCVKKENTDPKS